MLKKSLQRKISNNHELLDAEKGFMEKEGLIRLSMTEIIAKHKDFFKMENFVKILEKRKAETAKNKLKEQERFNKKNVIQDDQISSPMSISSRMVSKKKEPGKKGGSTTEKCWFLTEKTNKIVENHVNQEIDENNLEIKTLLAKFSPNHRKMREKEIKNELLNKRYYRNLNMKFRDLSLSSTGNKAN